MKKQNIVSVELPTAVGNFRLHVWDGDRGRELVALSTPTLDAAREIMVRVHSECLTGDIFRSLACDCGPQKDLALQKIQEHGNGIFIYHRQEGRNTGLYKKVQSYNLMQQGMDTHDALLSLVGHPDPREYSDILTALSQLLDNKKSHIRLLSNNPYKALFLERYGYQVALEPLRTATSLHSAAYTDAKTQKFLHNTVGYAPYTSITLSRGDIQQRLPSIATILSSVHPWIEARKLFIGLGMYPEKGDLSDAKLQSELETLYELVSKVQNANLVLHMDYPLSRSAQRELKRFLGKLAFPYSLQFRLPISAPECRIDVELIDSFHGAHVIFQLKEEHCTLLEQKGFIDYFSSPNKFLLLDESWAKGTREDVAIKKTRILKLISRGLSRIAVAGGYGADSAPEIHELEDFFKLPISVDAESQLRTDGYVDEVKAAAYLSFFFQSTMKYMTAKHRWVPGALALFERMAKDRTSYCLDILGKNIPVLPGVFSAKYFPDAMWFAKTIPPMVGNRSFLEIGTGTGMVALFVGQRGSKKIVTTDINPRAIRNARKTFDLYSLRIPVRVGNVFEPIRATEKFDVIFWNHPFHYATTEPKSMLLRAGFDYEYKDLRLFFEGARKHLNPKGEILLGTGNMARINEIKRIARENNYRWTLLKKSTIPPQAGCRAPRENRIYSFKSRSV